MDKRFWSGAVAVVTVVIAGAGVLPSLLLRPAVDDDPMAGSVEPAPFISKPVKLVGYEPPPPVAAGMSAPVPLVVARPPEPKPETRAEPKPAGVLTAVPPPAAAIVQVAASHAVPPPAAQTKLVHEVSAAAVPSAPLMTTAAVSASAPAASRAVVAAFPPIQPVGVATQSGLDPKPKASAVPLDITAKTVQQVREKREKVVRKATSRERARPRRYGRPAPFPIRQFLAALRR
jgi:hypothetical protein